MADESSEEGPEGGIGAAARLQFQSEDTVTTPTVQGGNRGPVDSAFGIGTTEFGDPQPPTLSASPEQIEAYNASVNNYAEEMLDCLQQSALSGKDLWLEFTCSFQDFTLRAMSTRYQLKWTQFLRKNGVHIKSDRGYARWKALRDCLLADDFEPSNAITVQPNRLLDETAGQNLTERDDVLQTTERVDSAHSGQMAEIQGANTTTLVRNRDQVTAQYSTRAYERKPNQPVEVSFSAHRRKLCRDQSDHNFRSKTGIESDQPTEHSGGYSRQNGVDALMKAYSNRSKFSGSFTEDFDGSVEEFETISQVCGLTEADMGKGFPIMLTGAAFSHFSRHYAKKQLSYSELKDSFRAWYTSEEQRYRLLQIWQSPSLTRDMRNCPEKSELEVFRELSNELTRVQHQLHRDYHGDRFLRDQLLRAADISHLRRSLIDKIPATAQEAMQRIATLLSSEPKSAGANFMHDNLSEEEYDEVHYGLGKRFGGHAKKNLRGSHFKKKKPGRSHRLASIKGCWVCGGDHRAKERHSNQEILEALNKIKSQRSKTLYTSDQVSEMVSVFMTVDDDENEESLSDDESDEDAVVNFMATDESQEVSLLAEIHLANSAFAHGSTFASDLSRDMEAMNNALHVGETTRFEGIILDTGANRRSAMSLHQYKAYCTEFHVPMNIDYTDNRSLVGIGGHGRAIGSATVPIPFTELGIVIDVHFRILDAKCPTLLSLRDMKENGLDLSLQDTTISFKHKIQNLSFENDFLVHKWSNKDMDYFLYTESELRRLHRVFGHPTVSALQKLRRRANPDELGAEVKKTLYEITQACSTCGAYSSKPRRFKITIGTDDLRFNHILAIDVMYLNGKPVLHAVDEATHYNAAVFLRSMTAEETWKALLRCWIRTYLGPPDHLRVDQGSNFVSNHFLDSAEAEGIKVLQAPIESPSTMSHVERYHAPLRAAYLKIRDSLPKSESDTDCLQLAVKCVNDTVGPEGLCPTLLVYGAIPRPPRRTPADTQLERARALDQATKEVQKENAKRRIAFALRHPSGPKAKEQEAELEKLPAGASILVYRDKTKKWEGPFPFVSIQGNTAVVQMPSGRKLFSSTVVKPAPHTNAKENWRVMDDTTVRVTETTVPGRHMSNGKETAEQEDSQDSALCDSTYIASAGEYANKELLSVMFGAGEQRAATPSTEHTFIESRGAELQGLANRGTFQVVKISSVPKGVRIYGTRWVDVIKIVDGKEVQKSRLVAQNYRDKGATSISTRSPTVSRMGQRVTLAMASLFPEHKSYIRDISQAYIQSSTVLERPIYLRPPKEMGLANDEILLASKPLYGIPESGLHWFVTYHNHHIEQLDMKACRSDTCVLYSRKKDVGLIGMTALQVDDAFGHGDVKFLEKEEEKSKRFQCKPRKVFRPGDSAFFNGCSISVMDHGAHCIGQAVKLRSLKEPMDQTELVSSKALVQYIGSCTRPDLCAPAQLLSQEVSSPTKETFLKMNKIIKWCHDTSSVGLKFVPLNRDKLRLQLFTDASFANANRLKSQLGFVVMLVDDTGKCNILHYGSTTCKRVARSVMAAELHALIYGFDNAYMVQDIVSEIMGRKIEIDAYVDSRTVFNVVAKHSATLEKRLQIDVNALRQSHSNGELRYLAWIPGFQNLADGLTKGLVGKTHPLWRALTTNRVSITPEGWVRSKPHGNNSSKENL